MANNFAEIEFNFLPGYGTPTENSLFAVYNDATGVETSGFVNELLAGSYEGATGIPMSPMPHGDFGSYTSQSNEVQLPLYRIRGYYVAGSTYEFWTGTSISTPNPSGNPLINKVVDAILSSC